LHVRSKRTLEMSVSSGVGLAHSAIIKMRLALSLHTLQPYALICQYMAPLTQWVPLLFTLDQRLTVSSAALLTSVILVSRETLLQACRSNAATLWMALVQVQLGGVAIFRWVLACLQASFPVLLTLLLPLRRRAVVTTCLRKVKHRRSITAPRRISRLVVPPLVLTVSTWKPMYARMLPSWTGMPMSVRALGCPLTTTTMLMMVVMMTLSAKSLALHPGSHLLSTLISLLALSTPTSTLLALHFSLHSPPSPLPSPLLLLLLLLRSPSEIQEFLLTPKTICQKHLL